MDFPKNKMPPPGGKPGLMVAIGVGKPKPGDNDADAPMKPPPGASDPNDPDEDSDDDSKISPDKAMVIRGDQHCAQCSNYHGEDGSCEKVDGQLSPDDACYVFFDPISGEGEEGDMGGAPPAGGPMGANLGQSS